MPDISRKKPANQRHFDGRIPLFVQEISEIGEFVVCDERNWDAFDGDILAAYLFCAFSGTAINCTRSGCATISQPNRDVAIFRRDLAFGIKEGEIFKSKTYKRCELNQFVVVGPRILAQF